MSTSTGTTSSASVYTTPAFWAPESLKRHREARQRSATVQQRYREFLALWRTPDPDRPEVRYRRGVSGESASSLRDSTRTH